MKTVLITPDGAAVRNFLCTRFVDRLLDAGEVVVWHALPEDALEPHRERLAGAALRWRRLPAFREGPAERVLRQAKVFSQLYGQREQDGVVLRFLSRPRRLPTLGVWLLARALGRLMAGARGSAALDRWHARATLGASYQGAFEEILAEERPDVVFCGHQRASRAVPAMLAARRLGLPAATFIYSWDNLPKGRMAVHADHFLVWSDFMAEELRRYYPEVAPERVHAVGTPQFEPYFDPALRRAREDFLGGLGLDPARPVVCFSGCDVVSARHDPAYLADLARGLRALPAAERPQILFRRSPADFSDRYDPVLAAYPEIAVSDPRWYVSKEGDWTQIVATREDVALLVGVVDHCAAVVNVGSTMGMDFAIRDKPAIFIAYDPPGAPPAPGRPSIDDSYRLPHFRSVHRHDPVYWARGADSLVPLLRHALAHPEEKTAARRAWLAEQVARPMDRASRRAVNVLRALARKVLARKVPPVSQVE